MAFDSSRPVECYSAEKLLFRVMPSLWPVVHRLATGEAWPPSSQDAARHFVQRVNQESLLPLLANDQEQPPEVRAALASSSALLRAGEARTRIILQALDRAGHLLEGVSWIALKGCDFALRLYPRPELRPMADIDVLVHEADLERVAALLEERGLVREFPAGAPSRAPSHHEAIFRLGNVTFEVHQFFAQKTRYRIDYEAIWQRAVPFQMPGRAALRLSDADAFVYQTISIGIKYFVSPLIRFVDLWLMLQANPDLVARGAQIARQWRAVNTYYAVLRYASALFPEFRSEEIEAPLREVASAQRRAFLDRFVIPAAMHGQKVVPGRIRQLWQKFWLMDDLERRLAFAFSHSQAAITGRRA